MGKTRQINIKNQINLKDFNARLLKIDKKYYKDIYIYYIGYVTVKKIANCNNINSVNPLYLMINEMIGHLEEKNENKYLVLDDVDKNKDVLNKYEKVSEGIKKEIETINGGEKIFRKLDLSVMMICHKTIKLRLLPITIRSVSEGSKFYPQLFLDDVLYEL